MKSRIIRAAQEKPQFKCGEILEYIPKEYDPEGLRIIIMYLSDNGGATFCGVCLHVQNEISWHVGQYSDCLVKDAFKLFDGTLELSN